jgi:hypothetical protein
VRLAYSAKEAPAVRELLLQGFTRTEIAAGLEEGMLVQVPGPYGNGGRMLIRWSIWGQSATSETEMLIDSISSFRAVLGSEAEYLVHTDNPDLVKNAIGKLADVRSYFEHPSPSFAYFEVPWAKWCPSARLAPGEVEVLVDNDVFLLDRPDEWFALGEADSPVAYLVLAEINPGAWQRGCFSSEISAQTPFINAGVFAQGPLADISEPLAAMYKYWKDEKSPAVHKRHDEQGALTKVLEPEFISGRAKTLPPHRYTIVSPRTNWELESLDGLALIHTTYPDHPAYHRFKDYIRQRGR